MSIDTRLVEVTETNDQWNAILYILNHFDVLPDIRDKIAREVRIHWGAESWSMTVSADTERIMRQICARFEREIEEAVNR